jgi:hypothetical protein
LFLIAFEAGKKKRWQLPSADPMLLCGWVMPQDAELASLLMQVPSGLGGSAQVLPFPKNSMREPKLYIIVLGLFPSIHSTKNEDLGNSPLGGIRTHLQESTSNLEFEFCA